MDKPMLFSTPMIRALLGGGKSQTRRVVKPQPGQSVHHGYPRPDGDFTWCLDTGHGVSDRIVCPFGRAGDRLWVRESGWQRMGASGTFDPYYYDASVSADVALWLKEAHGFRRRPSIHMPRWASRLTLKITDVRVEQLQEISDDAAAAEGWPGPDAENTIRNAYPIAWYSHLWDQLNGKSAPWSANPWVWVLSFEVLQ